MYTYSESYELRKFLSGIYKKSSDSFDILLEKAFSSSSVEEINAIHKHADSELRIIKACDELMQAIFEATIK